MEDQDTSRAGTQPTNPAALSTYPTRTNSDLAMFVFKPDIASSSAKKDKKT
jgi:hypothetical protein